MQEMFKWLPDQKKCSKTKTVFSAFEKNHS